MKKALTVGANALKVIKPTDLEKKPSFTYFGDDLAKARKNLRGEAQLLSTTGKILLVLGIIGEFALCSLNGVVFDLCMLIQTALTGSANNGIGTVAALGICFVGLIFASLCIFLASVLFGVAEKLRTEAKRLNQANK